MCSVKAHSHAPFLSSGSKVSLYSSDWNSEARFKPTMKCLKGWSLLINCWRGDVNKESLLDNKVPEILLLVQPRHDTDRNTLAFFLPAHK
jgi:hypothetical protein